MIAVALVIVIVGFIVASHQVLVRADSGSAELRRALREIETARAFVARRSEDLVLSTRNAEETANRYQEEATSMTREAEDLAAALERLLAAPREKVYVADRNTARSRRIWEIGVAHEGLTRHQVDAFARSWSTGRRYALVAESEKIAKQRADMRFPGVLGYRVTQVKPASF
ncbi:hypothetical protein [Arenibaculum pallidiluteum]|uniref:hypothetical protein n=1 Tax=Arenibaculum pallidiluteum TaxID=2812559 RepID=UPI001A975E4F|nr:hypothetical protein [Arenibaculum pallidiluteum]